VDAFCFIHKENYNTEKQKLQEKFSNMLFYIPAFFILSSEEREYSS